MGIFVPEAYLPMGVTVSNVYMSFSGEVIYTVPRSGQYNVNTYYKVYKDETKQPDTNIRIPISVNVISITGRDVYTILYDELKTLYPGSTDVFPQFISILDPNAYQISDEDRAFGEETLELAKEYMVNHPDDTNVKTLYDDADAFFGKIEEGVEKMRILRSAITIAV